MQTTLVIKAKYQLDGSIKKCNLIKLIREKSYEHILMMLINVYVSYICDTSKIF
jgi:hypothetical protein